MLPRIPTIYAVHSLLALTLPAASASNPNTMGPKLSEARWRTSILYAASTRCIVAACDYPLRCVSRSRVLNSSRLMSFTHSHRNRWYPTRKCSTDVGESSCVYRPSSRRTRSDSECPWLLRHPWDNGAFQ